VDLFWRVTSVAYQERIGRGQTLHICLHLHIHYGKYVVILSEFLNIVFVGCKSIWLGAARSSGN